MNAQTLDWSDIPYVLAVCETGSLSGAARNLGVNHSTVFRRIENIEKKLGVTLFERLSHGYMMTIAGEYFLKQALKIKEHVTRIERELGGKDLRLEGTLTITTTDSLLHGLASVFSKFQDQYPDIEMRILSDTRSLDLIHRNADIALRATSDPPEHWSGRKLSQIAYSTYAHSNYAAIIRDLPPQNHRWIRLIDELSHSPMNKITQKKKATGAPVTISGSLMGVFDLVRTGLGIASLPCYLGESCIDLVKLDEQISEFNSDLWILSHPDMRRNAKVDSFFKFIAAETQNGHCNFT